MLAVRSVLLSAVTLHPGEKPSPCPDVQAQNRPDDKAVEMTQVPVLAVHTAMDRRLATALIEALAQLDRKSSPVVLAVLLPPALAKGKDHPAQKPARPVLSVFALKDPPAAQSARADPGKGLAPRCVQGLPALYLVRFGVRLRWKILCSQ